MWSCIKRKEGFFDNSCVIWYIGLKLISLLVSWYLQKNESISNLCSVMVSARHHVSSTLLSHQLSFRTPWPSPLYHCYTLSTTFIQILISFPYSKTSHSVMSRSDLYERRADRISALISPRYAISLLPNRCWDKISFYRCSPEVRVLAGDQWLHWQIDTNLDMTNLHHHPWKEVQNCFDITPKKCHLFISNLQQ